jgi:hypothetical protein
MKSNKPTYSQGGGEYPTDRKADYIGHILRRNCLLNTLLKDRRKNRSEGKTKKGSKQLLDELKETRRY